VKDDLQILFNAFTQNEALITKEITLEQNRILRVLVPQAVLLTAYSAIRMKGNQDWLISNTPLAAVVITLVLWAGICAANAAGNRLLDKREALTNAINKPPDVNTIVEFDEETKTGLLPNLGTDRGLLAWTPWAGFLSMHVIPAAIIVAWAVVWWAGI